MATLSEYYREQGESDHVARLEAAVTGEWASSLAIAERAGVSVKWARRALVYLFEEGRVEQMRAMSKEYRPRGWRWEWRLPSSS